MRILLVDDDPEIRLGFRVALRRRGHEVATAATAAEALRMVAAVGPDIAIIDIMLPDANGLQLSTELRASWKLPTVMLTALDDDRDVVDGLLAGADDYIVKPVSVSVLEARMVAVLRRVSAAGDVPVAAGEPSRLGQLLVHEVTVSTVDGQELPLTPTELRLLRELVDHGGHVMTREQIIDEVWREAAPSTARVVDTTMQRLRAKLVAAGVEHPMLETVRGIGYRLR